jgi:hypothetical protein
MLGADMLIASIKKEGLLIYLTFKNIVHVIEKMGSII